MKNYTLYMHVSPNGKRYVGITGMKPYERWKNGNGYWHNKYFHNSIKKYGWNNFKHIIIRDNLSKKAAEKMEVELIAKYKCNTPKYGYNVSNGGETIGKVSDKTKELLRSISTGYKHTESAKQAISNAMSRGNNPNAKPVNQYDLQGNFIKTWDCTPSAADALKISRSAMQNCCLRKSQRKAKGFMWRYTDDEIPLDVENVGRKIRKTVNQYTLDGELIDSFNNCEMAAEKINFQNVQVVV